MTTPPMIMVPLSRSRGALSARTSSGRSPSHTYDEAGTYSIKLTVTSSGGVTDSVTRSVTVGD